MGAIIDGLVEWSKLQEPILRAVGIEAEIKVPVEIDCPSNKSLAMFFHASPSAEYPRFGNLKYLFEIGGISSQALQETI